MAAWLVTEDPQTLIRIDGITSVSAVPVNDRGDGGWHNLHPSKRLSRADHVHIMVGAGGPQVRALTCPGREALAVLTELTGLVRELAGEDGTVYVCGPSGHWPWRADRIWQVVSKVPEPEWPVLR